MARSIRMLFPGATWLVLSTLAGPASTALPEPACLERRVPIPAPPGLVIDKIARDGSTMIGHTNFGAPVVWRKDESGAFVFEFFPIPPNATAIGLEGVSNEGRVLVGSGLFGEPFGQAFRWSEATGVEVLDTGHDLPSVALDVSADGTKVVGRYDAPLEGDFLCGDVIRPHSFLWEGGGFTELAPTPPRGLPPAGDLPDGCTAMGSESRVNAVVSEISGDGMSIVGQTREEHFTITQGDCPQIPFCRTEGLKVEAAFWTGGGTAFPLGDLGLECPAPFPSQPPRHSQSLAAHVSTEGSVVLGTVFASDIFDPSHEECRFQPAKWLETVGPVPVFLQPPLQSSALVAEDGKAILASRREADNITRVSVFEDSPVPRRLDEILTEDFCVDLQGTIIKVIDVTNLEGGGLIVFVVQSNPPSGPTFLQYLVLPCRDPDQDGLCSEWEEMGGIDFDGDGKITSPSAGGADLVLKGADPMHKDIYVEIDEISGSSVDTQALKDVEQAFSIVPNFLIGNPDGNPGITLHLESGFDNDLQLMSGTNQWGPKESCQQPADMLFFRASKFGTPDERAHALVIQAKSVLYRYLVFGGEGTSAAEPFGNDLFVALAADTPPDGTRERQATVIMHELGHTFGLRHGGVDHTNNKPNYHSIMNYAWEYRADDAVDASTQGQKAYADSWVLDYSRRPFHLLAESLLSEPDGIGGSVLHFAPAGPSRPCVHPDAAFCARLVNEGSPADWDEDGMIDLDPVGPINVNEVVVGKGGAANDVLLPAEDWSTVADLYQDLRHPNWKIGPSVAESCFLFSKTIEEGEAGLVELTEEEIDELRKQPFAIDCDENGIVDDDDLAAGNDTDINNNGVLDGCEPLPGDIDLDEDVDEDDRQLLIASFGRGEGEDEYLELADLDRDRTVTFRDYQDWLGSPSRQAAGLGEATVRFEPSLATVPLGEDVSVEIVGDIGSPVLGFGLDLAFDPAMVGVVGSPEIGPEWQAAFATDGDELVGVGPTSGVSGSGVLLARVTLRALRPGLSELVASITDDDLAEGLPLEGSGFAAVTFETGQVRVPEPGLVGLLAALLLLRTIRGRMDSRDTSDRSSRKTPIESL